LEIQEKFVIRITDQGMEICLQDKGREPILFEPLEALMLLDILKNEETKLRKIADEKSPMPFRVGFSQEDDVKKSD